MSGEKTYYKKNKSDKIWWVDFSNYDGGLSISFDKKTDIDLFTEYPWKLTPEQKEIFDRENPGWAEFFKDRK